MGDWNSSGQGDQCVCEHLSNFSLKPEISFFSSPPNELKMDHLAPSSLPLFFFVFIYCLLTSSFLLWTYTQHSASCRWKKNGVKYRSWEKGRGGLVNSLSAPHPFPFGACKQLHITQNLSPLSCEMFPNRPPLTHMYIYVHTHRQLQSPSSCSWSCSRHVLQPPLFCSVSWCLLAALVYLSDDL